MLVDSHCHLDFDVFDADREAVFARAAEAGVATWLSISTYLRVADKIRATAELHPFAGYSIGTHPHNAAEEREVTTADLVAASRQERVVAIGESGLDYYYDNSPRDVQAECFRRHCRAAVETDLPIIVHTRDAEEDTIRILEEELQGGALKGVLHCFSGSQWLADRALDLGFSISFSGIVTFKKALALQQVAASVPLDRLLVETDAPYLAPVPMRGKRNEPAFVRHTAAKLAALKGVDEGEIAARTTENYFRLFDRAARPNR